MGAALRAAEAAGTAKDVVELPAGTDEEEAEDTIPAAVAAVEHPGLTS